ncbi:YraN family protein [Shewanella sp. SR44-3]|uniref:YraN family protein n=1 Tax=Shewanella sp. SR44-3 TaxID=2760936 RepID=UPI0015F9C4EC|nr:YraN family protein [Shewanella sp. SR44-3]MBB1269384.1 YraN family protein [Shewanella sp. SR44-3]
MTTGQEAEQLARTYLEQQGLEYVAHNVRYPFGELDLVMREQKFWVFVEVKFRTNLQFGGALQAIRPKQIQRIRKAANHYLQLNKINAPCRFDVLAIDGTQINWLQGCF